MKKLITLLLLAYLLLTVVACIKENGKDKPNLTQSETLSYIRTGTTTFESSLDICSNGSWVHGEYWGSFGFLPDGRAFVIVDECSACLIDNYNYQTYQNCICKSQCDDIFERYRWEPIDCPDECDRYHQRMVYNPIQSSGAFITVYVYTKGDMFPVVKPPNAQNLPDYIDFNTTAYDGGAGILLPDDTLFTKPNRSLTSDFDENYYRLWSEGKVCIYYLVTLFYNDNTECCLFERALCNKVF